MRSDHPSLEVSADFRVPLTTAKASLKRMQDVVKSWAAKAEDLGLSRRERSLMERAFRLAT
jgi:hypothetical protein